MTFRRDFAEFLVHDVEIGKRTEEVDESYNPKGMTFSVDYEVVASIQPQLRPRDTDVGGAQKALTTHRIYTPVEDNDDEVMEVTRGMYVKDTDTERMYKVVDVYAPLNNHLQIDVEAIEDG